jgi:hypothetical protein
MTPCRSHSSFHKDCVYCILWRVELQRVVMVMMQPKEAEQVI